MKKDDITCARCGIAIAERICRKTDGRHPKNCPTANLPEEKERVLQQYSRGDIETFAKIASVQESEGYSCRDLGYDHVKPLKPRVEEIMEFIARMGYTKIGLAFCVGLRKEAAIFERLLTSRELHVVSAICKIGGVPKEDLGLKDDEKICAGSYETMCNPILQAELLNKNNTEFNVLLGLCVGHDSMFFQYADAPCTVLAVKDRVTGHNPLAAIYTLDSYYRSLK